ncbi:MAG: hypothetical protein NVS1B6_18680 [Steroidobacteraceae bacterium]
MERYAEMPTNDFGDARTGPQSIRPTVGVGTLAKQIVKQMQLFGGQAWCRAELGLGSQAVRLASRSQPTVHGYAINADNARDRLGALALTDRIHGLPAAAFKFRRSSKWSTHSELDRRIKKTIHCRRSWQ